MYSKIAFVGGRPFLGAAAVACTLLAGAIASADPPIVVSVRVSPQGLDLNRPADAQTFYTRLQRAARLVCTNGNKLGLEPLPDPAGCAEQALGNAIRSAKVPSLTQIYLASHTPGQAAAYAISMPAQVVTLAPRSVDRLGSP